MPVYCAGLEDPNGGAARPCIFAQDGMGGPAQPGKKRCSLCSLESLGGALASRVGKGNLVRQLKHWRQLGSPTYEAAFTLGLLCALPTSQQYSLRAKAGEAAKFLTSASWLHKKRKRLRHFLFGRPIPAASPSLSASSREYLQAAASPPGQRWRLHRAYMLRREMEPFSKVKTKCKRRTFWQGKPAIVRFHRRGWWRARRTLKTIYLSKLAEGPPLNIKALKWTVEEGLI